MKLLIKTREIEKEFKRLINSYSEFFWASAWAGVDFECFTDLKRNKDKIRKILVGTSFDHTKPEFIREFMKTENVRFFRQKNGTFHPKIYLFQNNKSDWEMLIGSMNFTSGGFSDNTEVLALITQDDDDTNEIYDNARKLIDESWEKGGYFSEKELDAYKTAHKNQQARSGKHWKGKLGKSTHQLKNTSWQEFVENVKTEKAGGYPDIFKERLAVLDRAKELFREYPHFSSMEDSDRKGIAGFIGGKTCVIDWFLFGSMLYPKFKQEINNNNEHISLALDNIPLEGEITKTHYENFLEEIKNAFPDGGLGIATASRLLTMKRPDVFICFDNKNRKKLCEEFGIKNSDEFKKLTERTCERYWDEIIEKIRESGWWKSPKPENRTEIKIWNGRSAFLDALYYEE